MYRHGIAIFCLVIAHPSLCYRKMNMAADPILEYLNVDPKTVMEYELITIELPGNIHKRSTENNRWQNANVRTRTFGENINMWLHPRDSLFASAKTPVYFANVDPNLPGNVDYHLKKNAMKRIGQLFENAEHRASFVIGSDSDTKEAAVTGKFKSREDNATIIIRPVPAHVVEEHLRKRRSAENTDESSSNEARHVALKFEDNLADTYESIFPTDVETTDPPNLGIILNEEELYDHKTTGRPKPRSSSVNYTKSIYPKLFLHFDYTYYKGPFWNHQRNKFDLTRFLEYVLAFWNGVDLSYRHLRKPSIRLHIAGIAVATAFWATPYIEKHTTKFNNGSQGKITRHNTFSAKMALRDTASFFYKVKEQIPFEMYDVAITMTKLKMDHSIVGTALERGACKFDNSRGQQYGIALVHDNGAFRGIDTAAHELGHLLGMRDDESEACNGNFGYIMTPNTTPTKNTAMFSPCSIRDLNKALRSGELKCMYDPPSKKVNLPKLMPGKIKTLDEQCKAHGYLDICSSSEEDFCTVLQCKNHVTGDDKGKCQKVAHGAAPGSPCGNDINGNPRFCLQKQCVSLN